MKDTSKTTLTLSKNELKTLHTALCFYRSEIGNLTGKMVLMGIDTSETNNLLNQVGTLASKVLEHIDQEED